VLQLNPPPIHKLNLKTGKRIEDKAKNNSKAKGVGLIRGKKKDNARQKCDELRLEPLRECVAYFTIFTHTHITLAVLCVCVLIKADNCKTEMCLTNVFLLFSLKRNGKRKLFWFFSSFFGSVSLFACKERKQHSTLAIYPNATFSRLAIAEQDQGAVRPIRATSSRECVCLVFYTWEYKSENNKRTVPTGW